MASFISTEDLGLLLRVDLEDDDLAVIAVDAASEVVRGYCHQEFDAASSQTVVLDGTGTSWLLLPQTPVTAVSTVSVAYGTDAVTALTQGQDDDYLWYEDGRLARLGAAWPSTPQSVSVVYSYGYSTVPSAVRLVALSVAGRIYDNLGTKQETLSGYSVTYESGGPGLTAPERSILDRYRRRY